MRLLAILLLAMACTHEPTVPPARVARGPSERDLREGGMHAVCVQNALSACSRLECPACENLLSSGAPCAAGLPTMRQEPNQRALPKNHSL